MNRLRANVERVTSFGPSNGTGGTPPRSVARIAWSFWALVMVLAVASFVLRYWNSSELMTSVEGAEALSEVLWWAVLIPAAVPAYATVGAVVASRRPRNGIGWLCLSLSLVVAVQDVAWQYAGRALDIAPGSLPAGVPMAWIAQLFGTNLVPLLPFVLALLIFPNGRLPSRRWRFVAWIAIVGAVLSVFAVTVSPVIDAGLEEEIPNPIGIEGLAGISEVADEIGFFAAIFTLLASVVSIFLRWRWAGGGRQQLKWLAYTGGAIAAAVLGGLASGLSSGLSYPTVLIVGVAIAGVTIGIPTAIGVAILRYRLYDIDVIINRTLVYGTLTATLALVYVGSVVLLQQGFRALTGETSQLAVVASTLVIAALFQPLRRRVQVFIDRRFYRKKYDAAKTLAAFNARLRDEVELDVLTDDLVNVVRETLQPEHVSLWLRPPPDREV